jgi:hypothetical protein
VCVSLGLGNSVDSCLFGGRGVCVWFRVLWSSYAGCLPRGCLVSKDSCSLDVCLSVSCLILDFFF